MQNTTIEISKEYLHFAAAHFTLFSDTERENLHGHNFQVTLDAEAAIAEDGLTFDYNILKKALKQMCDDLDEQVIMPTQSPHLQIESDDHYTYVIFNGERIPFLERDLTLLPIRNVTVEELAHYLLATLIEREEIKVLDIQNMVLRCASGEANGPAPAGHRTRPSSQRLSGGMPMRCLVITGASSGIGHAPRRPSALTGIKSSTYLTQAVTLTAWSILQVIWPILTSFPTISEHLRAAVADADSLCLVHNAARLGHDTVQDIETDALRQIYEINLVAPTILNRLLLPHMTDGSSILYVGSTLGEKAVPGSFSYVVSKPMQSIGMMRASCQTWPERGSTPPASIRGLPIRKCCVITYRRTLCQTSPR